MRIRLNSPYWRRVCSAIDSLFFFVGVVVLLFLVSADLSLWVSCRDVDQSECLARLGSSQLQLEAAELGGNIRVSSGRR